MARKIELKIEKIEFEGVVSDFSYIKTIKSVLSKPGPGGMSLEDVRQSMNIINKIEASNGSKVADNITLEDAEWKYLNNRLKMFSWGIAHNGILNLCDGINNAKNVDI